MSRPRQLTQTGNVWTQNDLGQARNVLGLLERLGLVWHAIKGRDHPYRLVCKKKHRDAAMRLRVSMAEYRVQAEDRVRSTHL